MNNNQKRIRKLSIINSILIISLSFIMVTYAAFRSYASQQTTDTLTGTTCLTTTITDESAAINVANAYPISDREGLKSTPYTFKVSNNCDHYMTLNIGVETLTSSTIAANLIKGAINKVGNIPIKASLLTSGTKAEAQNGGTAYLLYSSVVAPNSSESYELRVWFTESMTTDQGANKKWDGKVIVSSTASLPETHLVVNMPSAKVSSFSSDYSGATWNAQKGILEIGSVSSNKQEIELSESASTGNNLSTYLKSLVSSTNTSVASGTDGTSYFVHEIANKVTVTPSTAKALTYYSSRSTSTSAPNFTWDSTNLTWTSNNNKTASTTATITFKPSTAGSAAFCYTVSSETNYDKAAVYVDNVLKKEVSGEETDCVILANLTTSNTIKVTYTKDGSQDKGNDNVIFSIKNFTSSVEEIDVGYRYQGTNPNNYISFNSELWRIIGVFDDSNHGVSGKSLVKIIKSEPLKNAVWGEQTSNWNNATVNKLLNENYYLSSNNNISDNCKAYINPTIKTNCNFENNRGIKYPFRAFIEENTVWYLGGHDDDGGMPFTSYQNERDSSKIPNSTFPSSSINPIGLMYASDYAFGVSLNNTGCSRNTVLKDYNTTACYTKNWLFNGGYEWTIGIRRATTINILTITGEGKISNLAATHGYTVRPALYLKENTKFVSGDGSAKNPYIIAI